MSLFNTRIIPAYVAIAMLLWALVPTNPYGYYMLLRVAVCGVGVYLAYEAVVAERGGLAWLLGGMAALYNPFVPVHLNREVWTILNIATIGLLLAAVVRMHRSGRIGEEDLEAR